MLSRWTDEDGEPLIRCVGDDAPSFEDSSEQATTGASNSSSGDTEAALTSSGHEGGYSRWLSASVPVKRAIASYCDYLYPQAIAHPVSARPGQVPTPPSETGR